MMSLLFLEICLSIFPLSISITESQESDPCVSYQVLRDSHRSQFHSISVFELARCDRDLPPIGWYRFKGKAGLKMPEACVKSGSCGTHAPGWFDGSHPTVPGVVSSGRVCFNWMGSCCQWLSNVKVKKCSSYYVYQLPQTLACDLQYCGDGAADPECAADNNDISINGTIPGSLLSPNFPGQYSNSLQCTWRITAPAGMRVRLVLKNATFGANVYMVLLDGLHENSTQIAKYTDLNTGELQLYSTDRYMLVKFVFNGSESGSGIRMEYESVLSKPTASNKTTTISSPSTVPTTKPADYAMDVKCDKDEMNVVLHIRTKLNHDPKSVRLNDASCKPTFQNSTHIFVKSTLEGCGTTSYVSKDKEMIVYGNAIFADVRNKKSFDSYATRAHQAVFEFQCRYKRRAVLSTVSFDPSKLLIITDIEAFGNFTFEMNMFKSEHFREYYADYPIGPIDVGAEIFLQVSVKSNDSGLVVLVDECKATPTADDDDQVQYVFIEDGCSKDNTLQYNYTLSSVQRFSLSAFSFRFEKSSQIFLHCQVKACRRSDQSSRCAKGCPFGKRRKRNSAYEVDRYLAIGPIIISQSRQPIERSEHLTPEKSTVAVGVLAGVLGSVAVLLIAALLLIVCKARQTPRYKGVATVLVGADEPGYG